MSCNNCCNNSKTGAQLPIGNSFTNLDFFVIYNPTTGRIEKVQKSTTTGLFLIASNNLSDVDNASDSRNNLDVYSKSEVYTQSQVDVLIAAIPVDEATWGQITGVLSNQTDLQNELDAKADLSGGNNFTGTQLITGSLNTSGVTSLATSGVNVNIGSPSSAVLNMLRSGLNYISANDASGAFRFITGGNSTSNYTLELSADRSATFASSLTVGGNFRLNAGSVLWQLYSSGNSFYIRDNTNNADIVDFRNDRVRVTKLIQADSGVNSTGAISVTTSENLLANFVSTDSVGEIRVADSAAYTRLLTVGNDFKILPANGNEVAVFEGDTLLTILRGDLKLGTEGQSNNLVILGDTGEDLTVTKNLDGSVSFENTNNEDFEFNGNVNVIDGGFLVSDIVKINESGFASLPPAGTPGRISVINDASGKSYGAVASGGGSDYAVVLDNGTNWIYS